jgi:hypothetical protein
MEENIILYNTNYSQFHKNELKRSIFTTFSTGQKWHIKVAGFAKALNFLGGTVKDARL